MFNKTLLTGALISIILSAPTFAGGGLVVNATNDAKNSTAIGGSAVHHTYGSDSKSNGSGPAIAGSIVMPANFDCDCLKELNLTNTSNKALAVGDAIAGSIVLLGRSHKY